MSKIKHKFSKHLMLADGTVEVFEASEADSWEEARKEVEKGVRDRSIELEAEQKVRDEKMRKEIASQQNKPASVGQLAPDPSHQAAGNPVAPTSNNTPPVKS